MKKDYHYLPIRAKELYWRYGALYVPWIILLIISGRSIVQFSIWYFIICVLLFIQEYFGVYFLIKDNVLIRKIFLRKDVKIPAENIERIVKGRFGLAHTESIELYYREEQSEKNITITLFSRGPKEIKKFIDDISNLNPNIVIDSDLKN